MPLRPTFTQPGIQPFQRGEFSHYENWKAKSRYDRGIDKTEPAPPVFDAPGLVSPTAVAAIRRSFLLAKTSKDNWKRFQREGKPDVKRAMAMQRGSLDIFRTKKGQSVTKVRVAVLIDASGSMGSNEVAISHPNNPKRGIKVTRAMAAAVFGATVCKALTAIPTVTLDVFQHAHGGGLHIKWRWAKGTPLFVFNEAARNDVPGVTNADGHALFAVATKMQREIKRDERGVIMVVSDGLPSAYARDGKSEAGQALIDAVAHARKLGIDVIGVAIDGSNQAAYYGDGLITFSKHDWTALGSELARHIGKALAGR